MMKLLLINPNTSAATTERMARVARVAAAPDVEIIAETAPFGAAHIRTGEELAVAEEAVLEIGKSHVRTVDAMIIGAFADPALERLRPIAGCPVVGIAQAALLSADLLGGPYGVATLVPGLIPKIEALARAYGVDRTLVASRGQEISDPRSDDKILEVLAMLIGDLERTDQVKTVIIAGGPIAGSHIPLRARTTVRLLDPVTCAVHLASALARC